MSMQIRRIVADKQPDSKGAQLSLSPVGLKRITTVSIVLLSIAMVLSFTLYIYPSVSKAKESQYKLDRAIAEIEGKQKLEKELKQVIAKYEDDLKVAEELVFSDRDIATFLENFSDFAKDSNTTLMKIRRQQEVVVPSQTEDEKRMAHAQNRGTKKEKAQKEMEKATPGLLMHPMHVTLNGEYHDLINFLMSLEGYKQLLTINNLRIGIPARKYPVLKADFVIRLYTMKSPESREGEEA
ncbi:hypothetical protein ACFL0T_08790 [Candidatus Omnitrophota bacterium]